MKVINNTSYNVTLINGQIIKKYSYVIINCPNKELSNQINNLKEDGILKVEN